MEALSLRVEERELLTDALTDADLRRLADSDDFFLFHDACRAVTLSLSRDASVVQHAAATPHPRLVGVGKGGHKHGAYPPSGVLPFEGMCALAAPLAYVYGDRAAMFHCLLYTSPSPRD